MENEEKVSKILHFYDIPIDQFEQIKVNFIEIITQIVHI